MNKIRKLDTSFRINEKDNKKKIDYLYIDADEDHMHLQKIDRKNTKNGNFIGKPIYLYKGYKKICNGRYKLINKFTFSELYKKSRENKALWEEVYEYICKNYDVNSIKKIYIQGDEANWFKEGVNLLPKSNFVLD